MEWRKSITETGEYESPVSSTGAPSTFTRRRSSVSSQIYQQFGSRSLRNATSPPHHGSIGLKRTRKVKVAEANKVECPVRNNSVDFGTGEQKPVRGILTVSDIQTSIEVQEPPTQESETTNQELQGSPIKNGSILERNDDGSVPEKTQNTSPKWKKALSYLIRKKDSSDVKTSHEHTDQKDCQPRSRRSSSINWFVRRMSILSGDPVEQGLHRRSSHSSMFILSQVRKIYQFLFCWL